MSARSTAEWCREREQSHRERAKDLTRPESNRRYHESEASSWAGEALFWEALADRSEQIKAQA